MTSERFKTRMAVFIVLRNEQGHILLQQRANTGYLDGYYDFACSGHVDPGESIRKTAVRELFEEIGVVALEQDLKLIHINQNNVDTPYTNFTFVLEKWSGDPVICEPEKCSDLAFFAQDKLPGKCTLNVRVNERDDFSDTLSYSYIDRDEFENMFSELG